MSYGELVNATSTALIFSPFVDNSSGAKNNLDLPLNTSVYLGFHLKADDPIFRINEDDKAEFGWVELFYDGTTIQTLNSATDRDGIGIYVGKFETAAIPEPSTLLLLLIGAPFLRRKS